MKTLAEYVKMDLFLGCVMYVHNCFPKFWQILKTFSRFWNDLYVLYIYILHMNETIEVRIPYIRMWYVL